VDSTAATLTEIIAVTAPTTDSTPDYTFSSDDSGTITYGGSCSSSTTEAVSGNNTITLVSLSKGTYSDCTVSVTDTTGNVSSSLTLSSFRVWGLIQESYIKAANNDSSDEFGQSISISGDTLAVGSWNEDSNQSSITNGTTASSNNSNISSGAVYVYTYTGK
jgi:hypothetical protein